MPFNLQQNPIQPRPDSLIFKPQNHNTKPRQVSSASCIVGFADDVGMPGPIKLDGYPFLKAIEIQYVLAHAVLAAEFAAVELGVFELIPEYSFGGGQVGAEGTAVGDFVGKVVRGLHGEG